MAQKRSRFAEPSLFQFFHIGEDGVGLGSFKAGAVSAGLKSNSSLERVRSKSAGENMGRISDAW